MSEVTVTLTDFTTDPATVVDLGDLGMTLLRESTVQIIPGVKPRVVKIPGRVGGLRVGVKKQSRHVSLKFHLSDDTNIENLLETLKGYLNPLNPVLNLCFSNRPNRYHLVRYTGSSGLKYYPKDAMVDLTLTAFDPYVYGEEETFNGNGTLTNSGTSISSPVISVSGPATDPVITIGAQTISYTGSIAGGETLEIDTVEYTVKIGSTNALPNLTGDLPNLPIGASIVSCSSGSMSISWRPRYLY